MPNSPAAKEPKFVTAGNALLPEFERCNFSLHSGPDDRINKLYDREYISIDRIWSKFNRVRDHGLGTEMERIVVCYLLGRAYKGPTLKVAISRPTWLEPICVGLTANPTEVSLEIQFLESDVRMVDSLQHIVSFLERCPSARGLHISHFNQGQEGIANKIKNFTIEAGVGVRYSVHTNALDGYGMYIAQAVRTNKLHTLDISDISANPRTETETEQVAEALTGNTSITDLRVQATSSILDCFVWKDSTAANHYVTSLTLVFFKHFQDLEKAELGDVLRTNQTLRKVKLVNAHFSQSECMDIVDSLKANKVLEVLELGRSTGWMSKKVLSALLDLVRTHCTQIIDLGFNDLSEDLQPASDLIILKEALPALNEQLRLNTKFGQVLKNVRKEAPRSARIVFCGPGYAGKTTFCKTMIRNQTSWLGRQIDMFLQKRPKVWRFLRGPDADKELHKRTRGVDMHLWKDEVKLRISLWDFAGQKEYYALHDYMFPNVNSANLFLFFFSLVASPLDTSGPNGDVSLRLSGIKTELFFWLRFLCSNSKEVMNPKPRVRVIITGKDRVDALKLPEWRTKISSCLSDLKKKFENRLDLVEPAIILNAHSEDNVKNVETHIIADFDEMVPKLEPTFAICEEVRRELAVHVSSTPVISLEEYDKICMRVDRLVLDGAERSQAVASYLHNVGEIIYFQKLNFIVTNPRWLGVGVLGKLLDVFGEKSETKSQGVIRCCQNISRPCERIYLENGFLNQEGLRTLLSDSLQSVTHSAGIGPDDFIELLCALEICYKDGEGFLIPAALDDVEEKAARGIRPLKWHEMGGNTTLECTFIGRRLQCADQDLTLLTPGFFPRLQVVLRNYLQEQKLLGEQGFSGFKIERNLLRFRHNAMDIIVEYGDGEQYRGPFVDVLVKTGRQHNFTVDFIEKHVLNVIRNFCAQPEGNQGVILVEGIIRPAAVEHLVQCKDRENQAILISELEEYLKKDESYKCGWNAVPSYVNEPFTDLGKPGEEYGLDAINGKGFHDELRRNQELQSKAEFQALSALSEVAILRSILERLVADTPKFVYILGDNNVSRFSSSHSTVRLRLHLGCERNDKPHVIENQKGRPFVIEGELRKTLMPLLQWAYKLLQLAGLAVAKTIPFVGSLEVLVGLLPSEVRSSSSAPFTQKTLEQMRIRGRDEMIRFHEEILRASPCCEWLMKFLDLQGKPERFKHDFSLYKAKYTDTQRIAFLCKSCYDDGIARHVLQLT